MTRLDDERAEFFETWPLLWDAAGSVAGGGDPGSALESVGLLLEPPDQPSGWDYDATPQDAVTFASTGGDGVHFSFVEMHEKSVIVMTVPMMWDRPNVVVGSNLLEFLSLGCRFGYFELEQLAYDFDRTVDAIEQAVNDDELLSALRIQLRLEPWPAIRARLEELAASTPQSRR